MAEMGSELMLYLRKIGFPLAWLTLIFTGFGKKSIFSCWVAQYWKQDSAYQTSLSVLLSTCP